MARVNLTYQAVNTITRLSLCLYLIHNVVVSISGAFLHEMVAVRRGGEREGGFVVESRGCGRVCGGGRGRSQSTHRQCGLKRKTPLFIATFVCKQWIGLPS